MKTEELAKKYRIIGDYHTHTIYSRVGPYFHGKGKVIDNAAAAVSKGLEELAITDHGPADFYGLDLKNVPKVRSDIAEAAVKYPDLKIFLGVEADIVDSPNGLDVNPEQFELFDFVNAGYHYVPNCHMISNWLAFRFPCPAAVKEKLRRQNTEIIIRALKNNKIRILTHPGDKAYIDEHAVAKACEETGTLIEINVRHRHPDKKDLLIYAGYDVSFVIDSDAHSPDKVGRHIKSLQLAISAGISPDRIVNIRELREE
jgi:putative hydrolase